MMISDAQRAQRDVTLFELSQGRAENVVESAANIETMNR